MCVCVFVHLLLQQAVSKETGGLMLLSRRQTDAAGGLTQTGRGLCSLLHTFGACGALCKHSRRLIPDMAGKETKQANNSNLKVIQDEILKIVLVIQIQGFMWIYSCDCSLEAQRQLSELIPLKKRNDG